jgi:iron complex outermembrane receptor protein
MNNQPTSKKYPTEEQNKLMNKTTYILLLLLLTIAVYAQNQTDTIDIPEVSITAKRKLKNTSLNISKIDSLQMRESVNADLGTLLSEFTPIFVKSEGRGALSTVSFRGTATSHTDVLWNGISLQSPMLGQIDFSLIPAYLSDDVSIYAGASSIANTSGALGGSIAINNKPDWNNKFSVKFIQALGSYTTINDYLQVKLGNKKLQSSTRLLYNYSKNDFEFVNKNIADIDPNTGEYIYPTQKNTNADYLNYSLLQELYFRLNSTNIFSVKYWF